MDELRKLVGGRFVVGFHGTTVSKEIKELIEEYYVGGVILFSRNIESAEQLATLTNNLQEIAKKAGYKNPLLICLDQENGVVNRLGSIITSLPGAMGLGATQKEENAKIAYSICASELKSLGINWNLAPVADINNNPKNPVIGVRSFGEDPYIVGKYVAQAVLGHQQDGVLATLKHFPGHGDTQVDSHLSLPTINHSLERLRQVEFIPFIDGIQAEAAVIMTSHILFPKIEKGLPASLSKKIVKILRDELSFNGLIVTDDLEMGAIVDDYGTIFAVQQAIKNGSDMVMISHSYELQREALITTYDKVYQGIIEKELLTASDTRMKKIFQRFSVDDHKADASELNAKKKENLPVAQKIYQETTTMITKHSDVFWREEESLLVISFRNKRLTNVEDAAIDHSILQKAITQKAKKFLIKNYDITDSLSSIIEDLETTTKMDHIILTTMNIRNQSDVQVLLYQELKKRGDNIAVIITRNPYDANYLSDADVLIATYDFSADSMSNAIKVLYGAESSGKLPVSLG